MTCHIAHVTCHMSNAYVDSWDMLNNFCFDVFAPMWVFVIMSHVACRMSHVTCHMSYVKCLCWSLGHAEQFLFSCLCSNIAGYGCKRQCFFFDTSTLTCEWSNHRAGSQLKMAGKLAMSPHDRIRRTSKSRITLRSSINNFTDHLRIEFHTQPADGRNKDEEDYGLWIIS